MEQSSGTCRSICTSESGIVPDDRVKTLDIARLSIGGKGLLFPSLTSGIMLAVST